MNWYRIAQEQGEFGFTEQFKVPLHPGPVRELEPGEMQKFKREEKEKGPWFLVVQRPGFQEKEYKDKSVEAIKPSQAMALLRKKYKDFIDDREAAGFDVISRFDDVEFQKRKEYQQSKKELKEQQREEAWWQD